MSVSDDTKIAVGRAMIDAWNDQDWDMAASMLTEDSILHSMMIDPIVGREAIHQRISGIGALADSIDLKLLNIGVINGTLYMERMDTFVCKGKPGATPVCGALEFEGDKIKVWREYYDRHHLLSEMGLTEDFGATAQ
ncbi:MAG TPA: limonene-1,2-epoxide hydrolase family protein [Sphingopyxis sp.]|uniref:limonene-1,2-epoxide hydrolase family protein n=1 Tax=Sphingopyxis sp. TaxID=1908224 RepID=UPI002C695AE5|nr:limonene-1,2-epoxide hydrolase family protein [Sphingopyxis sp.]HWW57616.1 limonene-1,2-epoxide hydrolase family protein [Sphingopyxis sp.]